MNTSREKNDPLESKSRALEEQMAASEKNSRERLDKFEQATARLKEENTYRRFFDTSAEAMLSLYDGYFIDCNESCVRMLRAKNKKEVFRLHPWEVSPPFQPDGRASEEKANEMIALAVKNGSHCFEWVHRRMNGEDFPVEVFLTAVTIDGKAMFNSTWREITDRKAAEAELARYREHLEELVEIKTEEIAAELKMHKQLEHDIRQILDATGDAIRVIDCDFNIVYANNALARLKKTSLDNLIGKKCYGATPAEMCFTGDCCLKRVLEDGISFSREKNMEADDGRAGTLLVRIEPHTDSDGNIIGAIESYRDITEEKLVQKAAEENAQQKGRIEMSNNLLHDIGNAMTGISAYILKPQVEKDWAEIKSMHQLAELFASKKQEMISALGEKKQHALEDFIQALIDSLEKRHADSTVFNEKIAAAVGHVCSVLDLQRHYMREKASPLATKINLSTIINDAWVMYSDSLEKRKIDVRLTTPDSNLSISGDQTRLIRVFLNIIKNTYEAFDEKEPDNERKLEITIIPDKNDRNVQVLFRDNAVGFDEETGGNLFTRGFTTKDSGTGIGLHESRSIIESHNGTITMQSDGINTGTLTTVTLPLFTNGKDKTA
jgi:PAS domain S-box-containing protein